MEDIARLLAGVERFKSRYFAEDTGLFSRLSHSQQPHSLVIACCDSRVDPAMLTGASPGDLFVIRDVANLVPPYRDDSHAPGVRAALEFAVKHLGIAHIIVLGHSRCGGIAALMEGAGQSEFIGPWVSLAEPARARVLHEHPQACAADQARACEKAAIQLSLENLLSFPWICERVEQNQIALHGWYFDIDTGDLLVYDAETGGFLPLSQDKAESFEFAPSP